MFNVGLLSLFLFNVFNAAKGVFLGSFLQTIHPFLVLSVCFGLVTIIFALINYKTYLNYLLRRRLIYHWKAIAILNVSALFGWSGFYYSLKFIEPAIVTTITSASGPILTAIYYSLVLKERKIQRLEWVLFILIWLGMAFLLAESCLGYSAVRRIPVSHTIIGFLCALVCGAMNVTTTIVSKELNQIGFSSREIIPLRFELLIILGAMLAPEAAWNSLNETQTTLSIAMIAVFGVAFPVYCFQKGIEYTNPLVVALVHATIPVFVLAAQLFDYRLSVSEHSIAGALIISGLSMLALYFNFSAKNSPVKI